MAFRRLNQAEWRNCYICDHLVKNRSQMRHLNRPVNDDGDEDYRIIVQEHRNNAGHDERDIGNDDIVCHTCDQRIRKSIKCSKLAHAIRLRIIPINHSNCFICFGASELRDVSRTARINAFIETELFIPARARCCKLHFLDDNNIQSVWLEGLTGYDSYIELPGSEIREWFLYLREAVRKSKNKRLGDINLYSDSELKTLIGLEREQFNNLYTYTTKAVVEDNVVYVQDLFIFLVKLRSGLSDEFLRVMFNLSQTAISKVIRIVRKNLMATFVPHHLGLQAHPRNQYIENYVPEFAQKLYNQRDPQNKHAIVLIDATYIYVFKSSNYQVLRQSFCVHKSRHLFKVAMLVSPNGRILDVHGPYFSDSKNNDARILINEMNKNQNELKEWLQNGDIVIVDRGYRDSLDYLDHLGIQTFSPAFLVKGKKQLDTIDANLSRIPTKNRWVGEARNSHVKHIWRFLLQVMPIQHCRNLGDFFRIAAALINAYFCQITMEHATPQLAQLMLDRINTPNEMLAMIEADPSISRNRTDWVDITSANLPAFPRLTLDYLRLLTFGTYQVNLASSYVHDKVRRDTQYRIQIIFERTGLLRARIYSRHKRGTEYYCYISYDDPAFAEQEIEPMEIEHDIQAGPSETRQSPHVIENISVPGTSEGYQSLCQTGVSGDEQVRSSLSVAGTSGVTQAHSASAIYIGADKNAEEESDEDTLMHVDGDDDDLDAHIGHETYDDELRRLRNEYENGKIYTWYCTCPNGARTVGCCGHIASILWFLGYARFQRNIRYPSNDLLETIETCERIGEPQIIDANALPRPPFN